MRIACLGWGSLVWDPKDLPVTLNKENKWNTDGPSLPIEFARISRGGRLTLVVFPGADPVQTYWADLDSSTLEKAVNALAKRECTPSGNVGRWSCTDGYSSPVIEDLGRVIGDWAEEKKLDAVVWTALGSNFEERFRQPFSIEHVVDYLNGLREDQLTWERAQEYIRRAPCQTDTSVRQGLRREFGWRDLANY